MKNKLKNILNSKLNLYITLSVLITLATLTFIYIQQQNIKPKVQENTLQIKENFHLEKETHSTGEDTIKVELKPIETKVQAEEIEQLEEQKSNVESEVMRNDSFYFYESIPIEKETQRFITKIAKEKGISVELIYAIAKVESDFDPNADNGTSVGMFQINRHNTLYWLAEQVGIDNVNPFNVRHSAQMSAWYLDYLYNKWDGKGYSEEDKIALVLCSYNRGYSSCNKYIKSHSPYEWFYVDKVLDYKIKLEKERYQ